VDVDFTNWRGIVAPPGLTDNGKRKLIALFTRLQQTPQWQEALRRNGWTPAFQPGPEFAGFLESENARVASVLKELGLA
jgi:putative tricarboxylic transport membrane protein